MDADCLHLAAALISSKSYVEQAGAALAHRRKLIKSLLSQRRLPEQGWDTISIQQLIQEAAMMDSNNFPGNVGVGEREARVVCPLVASRNHYLAHGVGRSGDIAAVQPKAAGSSMLAKLTNLLARDALDIAGLHDISAAVVLPLATGMAITSTLLVLKRIRPARARFVLWPRIDQKTCAKCVTAAGMELVVVPNQLEGDQLRTDMVHLRAEIDRLGPDSIVAVLSTTSCFAPRAADRLVEIAKLCREQDVGHIVNNAYGVQVDSPEQTGFLITPASSLQPNPSNLPQKPNLSSLASTCKRSCPQQQAKELCALVTAAWRRGRVDAVVQSTDKNFMVPVGGAIVAAGPGKAGVVDAVSAAYPGRASAAPMLDLLMTLLYWGASGWQKVLQEREELFAFTKGKLASFAAAHGCRLLQTTDNPISLALTLDGLLPLSPKGLSAESQTSSPDASAQKPAGHIVQDCKATTASHSAEQAAEVGVLGQADQSSVRDQLEDTGREVSSRPGEASGQLPITFLGSMLFSRRVSGTRVVARGKQLTLDGHSFQGYGAHFDTYEHDYLTVAAALGTTQGDINEFIQRLGKCMSEYRKKSKRS